MAAKVMIMMVAPHQHHLRPTKTMIMMIKRLHDDDYCKKIHHGEYHDDNNGALATAAGND
jgi:hypothetical protein